MRDSITSMIVLTAVAGLLAGCGASSAGVSTGSLFGSSKPQPVAAAKPVTPTDRAIYVAATSAKAQRCGYFFDPAQLKASYIAAETQAGTQPADLQKVNQAYDFTRAQIGVSIAKDDAYCTSAVNTQVKAALNRQLAGDFNPPARTTAVASGGGGFFDTLNQGTSRDKFEPQDVFDRAEGKIKPREE